VALSFFSSVTVLRRRERRWQAQAAEFFHASSVASIIASPCHSMLFFRAKIVAAVATMPPVCPAALPSLPCYAGDGFPRLAVAAHARPPLGAHNATASAALRPAFERSRRHVA